MIYESFFDNQILNKNKLKESWVKKNYSIEWSNILNYCNTNNLEGRFSQKIYHWIFKIEKIPECLQCRNKPKRFLGFAVGYNDYCSKSCASKSSAKMGIETRKEKTKEKWGVDVAASVVPFTG
jgi:hypothetical protein